MVSCTLPKEKVNTIPSTNTSIHNDDLPASYAGQWWHKFCGSNQPISNLKLIFHEIEAVLYTAVGQAHEIRRQGPREKPYTTILLEECRNKMTPSDILHYS